MTSRSTTIVRLCQIVAGTAAMLVMVAAKPACPGVQIAQVVDRKLPNLAESDIELVTGTDRGGRLAVYRDRGAIVRFDMTVCLSSSDLKYQFYYVNDKPIFVRIARIGYAYSPKTGRIDFGRKVSHLNAGFCINGRAIVPLADTPPELQISDAILAEANYVLQAIRKRSQSVDVESFAR
jgi:hypothetical protein